MLRGTAVASIVQDQMAAQHPGGPLVADALAEAAGVLTVDRIGHHYGARVKVIEDDDGGVIVIPTRSPSGDRDSAQAGTDGSIDPQPFFGSGAPHS